MSKRRLVEAGGCKSVGEEYQNNLKLYACCLQLFGKKATFATLYGKGIFIHTLIIQ